MVRVHRSPSAEYSPEGYTRLSNAIVVLAAKDYRRALIALKKNRYNSLREVLRWRLDCRPDNHRR